MMAVGVARPRAQGQAMTNTPTNDTRPKDRAWARVRYCDPTINQVPKVKKAITKVTGTKILEILSARA